MQVYLVIPLICHVTTAIMSYSVILNRVHRNKMVCAFLLSYSLDLIYCFVTKSTYFYKWTTFGLYMHHLPFSFLYSYMYLCVPCCEANRYFEIASALGCTSSLNEAIQIFGTLTGYHDHTYVRACSNIYGLLYFSLLANTSIFYGIMSSYRSVMNNESDKYHVSAISILCTGYAVYFYPGYCSAYYKRLKKLC